jgi:hypothetical protein
MPARTMKACEQGCRRTDAAMQTLLRVRKRMEPSPHPPEAIERARVIAAECRAGWRTRKKRWGTANRE